MNYKHPWGKPVVDSRTARNAQALRLARRLGIPASDVAARWRAGLRWCGTHGWETDEEHTKWHGFNAETSKLAKQRAKTDGRCTVCIHRPAVNATYCAECRDKKKAYDSARRREALAQGLCGACRSRPLRTKSHCDICAEKHNKRKMARYYRKKAEAAK